MLHRMCCAVRAIQQVLRASPFRAACPFSVLLQVPLTMLFLSRPYTTTTILGSCRNEGVFALIELISAVVFSVEYLARIWAIADSEVYSGCVRLFNARHGN
jgi:energy-converting hydrogenase Eha subunit C